MENMKYILLLSLVLVGCTKEAEPMYHYKDEVSVISGFYKGCWGEVNYFNPNSEPHYILYMQGKCYGATDNTTWFRTSELAPKK